LFVIKTMFSTILRTLKTRRNSLIAYSLVGILFMWMYVAMFPSFAKESDKFLDIMRTMPQGALEAFGVNTSKLIEFRLENFLATEMFTIVWPIMALAFMVSTGGAAIAGEIEKNTMDLLLSQPISRTKIFFSKYISGMISYVIFVLLTIFSVIPMANLYNTGYQLSNSIALTYLAILFGLAVFGMSLFFSSIFSERNRANLITSGILIIMYAVNIASHLIEKLKTLKYTSFFYYFDTSKALNDNKLNMLSVYVFLAFAIVSTALALLIFNRRDIST